MQPSKKGRTNHRRPPVPPVSQPGDLLLPLGRLYTLKEAAGILHVTPRVLRYWCRLRLVPIQQPARRIHILHAELQALLSRIKK